MVLDNDVRGWIMTALSGIACVFGASIICVDVIVRMFPGKNNFRIQDSNAFLSSSLSLSFGVMLFSSLYSMLPSAKSSLQKGGLSPRGAAWTLIALFIGGAVGIQFLSRVFHHFIPSHVVDCDHTHGEDDDKAAGSNEPHSHHGERRNGRPEPTRTAASDSLIRSSSLSSAGHSGTTTPSYDTSYGTETETQQTLNRRPSFHMQLTKTVSKLLPGTKRCDEDGICHGFSDRPCGQDCFRTVQARGGTRASAHSYLRKPGLIQSATAHPTGAPGGRLPLLGDTNEHSPLLPVHSAPAGKHVHEHPHPHSIRKPRSTESFSSHDSDHDHQHGSHMSEGAMHHHHVPTNAFLSIGLQTSIAIALHKLPEGFITYATNHANPKLGVSVFLALFIHNITEGFAMALPLYLAFGSRWKAMFWSSLLGGVSQPLGAGVAAFWFWAAGKSTGDGGGPGDGIYGGMFAVTAGIMASVALQLFSESLDLGHNRNLCMAFAFIGMAILGCSCALSA